MADQEGQEDTEMKGIKDSTGFDRFEGKAPAYSQNYDGKKRVMIVLSRSDGKTKLFAVSEKTYKSLERLACKYLEEPY
jgi:hypothetical protein